ncbi:NAD(P)-binding protein [Ophiocordyceps camponoti-floridani]|uniref:NAD(P)-binding protein n=1 Tax=Ophiocordyceps camponoti-floridani TaxID=2030778 RepID=A0A8H4Q5Q9_9HYPO|nr:NAD(P)-binding protein [Ophiocordyceps camponoti-floridani]
MASTEALSRATLYDLSERVALVTGGGSGIGLMAAQALAANGAKVYVCGRTKEKVERAATKHGKGAMVALQADVTCKDGIQSLYDELKSREGRLDILVNNAGIRSESFAIDEAKSAQDLKTTLFDEKKATFDDWLDTYRTNVASVYFTTAAMLPLLQASTEQHAGWSGTVINIGSVSGFVKTAQKHFSYNSSKAAVAHLTRMMASEVADAGVKVRINNLAPGVFPSEMTAGESDDAQKSRLDKQMVSHIPSGRPGKDEDMASTVLFLAANQYMNGQTVVVDGGFSIATGM